MSDTDDQLAGNKMCDECGVDVAVLRITPVTGDEERSNGPELKEMDICQDCADEILQGPGATKWDWEPLDWDSYEVDVIASGYEWDCPKCSRHNNEIEVLEKVTCEGCGTIWKTAPPEHAYE